MAFRASYRTGPHVLTLGSVIEASGTFFVCVLPSCDALRLESATTFPFLRLDPMAADGDADLIVVEGSDIKRLATVFRYEKLVLREFTPVPIGGPILERSQPAGSRFVDDEGREYRWVGELREAYALRLVDRLASGLSRIGLDESEWIRRMSENRVPAHERPDERPHKGDVAVGSAPLPSETAADGSGAAAAADGSRKSEPQVAPDDSANAASGDAR